MKLKQNAALCSALGLIIGLIAMGCTQTETTENSVSEATTPVVAKTASEGCSGCCGEANQETVICQKCGQEKTAGGNAEGCTECPDGQCTDVVAKTTAGKSDGCCGKCGGAEAKTAAAKPAGCCGKCAEELAASKKAAEPCGTCQACAEGDSANCKCDSAASVADPTKDAPADEKSDDSAASTPPGQTSNFANDRDVFHFLLSNKDKITRKVTELKDGVETVTESSDPAIAEKIQEHVAAMYHRVENRQPIRMRDPLFREVFRHTDKIKMELENTANGIRVKETSDDEYVAKVIQEHAKVVSGFVEYGFEEARKNHQPPKQ